MGGNVLGFESLMQVESIAQNITSLLSITDFLHLQQTNKYIHNKFQKLNIEEFKYRSYFKKWGISLSSSENIINDHTLRSDLDEINVFENVVDVPLTDIKQYFILFYNIFKPYVNKLYSNQINSNFFASSVKNSNTNTQDPVNQAHILSNILKYISASQHDHNYYQKIKGRYDILKDVFVNSTLKELEGSSTTMLLKRKFIVVLLLLHEYDISIDYFKSLSDFQGDVLQDIELFDEETREMNIIQEEQFWSKILQWFNKNIQLCDDLFEDDYPIIINFFEEVINESLLKYLKSQFNDANIQYFDVFFKHLQSEFIDKLVPSTNAGGLEKLKEIMTQFVILYFEPFITNFTNYIVNNFHKQVLDKLSLFAETVQSTELKENEQLYESIQKQYEQKRSEREEYLDSKNNFLRSFQQILKINNNKLDKIEKQNIEVEFNLNKMNKTLENIKSLIDLNLCMEIIQLAKLDISRVLSFKSLKNYKNEENIEKNCENIFKILIKELETKHVSPAFEKTITLLKEYNQIRSVDTNNNSVIEPLIKFTELINIGDVIIQLITIFYKNELLDKNIIQKKHNHDFLNEVIFMKKQFETDIDDFVAEGLNVGINKLMDEVEYMFNAFQLPTDYNPNVEIDEEDPTQSEYAMRDFTPTECCFKNINLIKNHCFLLNGITDKGTIEVYQQEIGERFFQCIVKNLKKNLISKKGAVYLICDINEYYNFVNNELKLCTILPYFESLKFIAQLFLIDGNGKELGKMICDPSRYNGIFTQEEVYEFVTRRSDWYKIKRQVDKTIYGLDCVIQ